MVNLFLLLKLHYSSWIVLVPPFPVAWRPLAAYSGDGLVEAYNGKEILGIKRLNELFIETKKMNANEASDYIFNYLNNKYRK